MVCPRGVRGSIESAGSDMKTSRSRKTDFSWIILRNADFPGSSQNQNKHALRERLPSAKIPGRETISKSLKVCFWLTDTFVEKKRLKSITSSNKWPITEC